MHWNKDSQKLKAILGKINIFLLAVAVAAGIFCGYRGWQVLHLPDVGAVTAGIQDRQEQIALLETDISEKNQAIALAEEESLAALAAAEQAHDTAQSEYSTVLAERDSLQARLDILSNAPAMEEQLKEDIAAIRTEYGLAIRRLEDKILAGESDYKICYLTFDDGPGYLTDQFLDTLDELDALATFFTIGRQLPEDQYAKRNALLRREALSGHSIANHTYTHAIFYGLYDDLESFMDSTIQQHDMVYEVTGIKMDLLRFPSGSYYCPFREDAIAALEELGYGWIDWSGNAFDSGTKDNNAKDTANNVIWQVRQEKICVMLMHDWRTGTLGALEKIITTLKAENYLFLPLFKESSTVGTVRPLWDYSG